MLQQRLMDDSMMNVSKPSSSSSANKLYTIILSASIFLLCLSVALTLPSNRSSSWAPPPPPSPSSSSSSSPRAHVILIAGQSNSVGYNTDGHTEEDVSYQQILQLNCCQNFSTGPASQCNFEMAQDPLLHYCDQAYQTSPSIGFAMSLARRYITQEMAWNDILILVPAGRSGTGFHDKTWNAYTGSGFKEAILRLQRTFYLLQTVYKQYTPVFVAVAWHQGEHDAGDNSDHYVATGDYYLNQDMIPMIQAFRDVQLMNFTRSNLPFIVGNLLPSWLTNTSYIGNVTHASQRKGVVDAIASLPQYVNYTAEVPSYGLTGDPVYLSGLDNEVIHFSGSSQRIFGRRYAAALQAAINNEADSRK